MKTNKNNTANTENKTRKNAKTPTKPQSAKAVKTSAPKAAAKGGAVSAQEQLVVMPTCIMCEPVALLTEHTAPASGQNAGQTVPAAKTIGGKTGTETLSEERRISENDDMTGQQTVMIDMNVLRPSSYNPRKYYDKKGIEELAVTLNEVGLLQPIHVRAVGEYYEIIFGERRFRAARSLKWKRIPAYIRTVSDEMARDMALTENLQREDMRPMDEAAAYIGQVREGKDIYTLAAKYGKSDRYIYDRLKLNDLIPPIADLLNRELICIGAALEIAKCERHIQEDMYENRLKGENENDDNPVYGWRGKSVTDFKRLILDTYTTDLERYNFDKTECLKCPHNTNTYDLFADCNGKCGHCTDTDCLRAKNEAYVLAKATALLKENPRAVVGQCYAGSHNSCVNELVAQGYECKNYGYDYRRFPTEPVAPRRETYEKPEQFAEAEQRYKQEREEYETEIAQINDMVEQGDARLYISPCDKDVAMVYKPVQKRPVEPDFVKRLTEQKTSNIQKAIAKTVEATREIVKDNVEPVSAYTELEDYMLYFVLLDALRPEHRQTLTGSRYACLLSSEQKLAIVRELTPEQKDVIRRDFIAAYLCEKTANDKILGQMLCEYASMHYPDKYGIAKAKIEEECENKNNRLDERIAEFKAKEKVRAEAAEKKNARKMELAKKTERKTGKQTDREQAA